MNYEVLCNAFATKIIDLSEAEIYLVKSTEISKADFETFLSEQNQYTIAKFAERHEKMLKLKEIEKQLQDKKLQSENERKVIEERQSKTFTEIR